jgi:hypothetical protein
MSIGVGTLQPKVRFGPPVLTTVVIALVAAATIGIYALTSESRTQTGTATSTTTITGTAANTPTELRGGILGAPLTHTAANTPSELRGGFIEAAAAPVVRPLGRAGVTPRVAEFTASANTPSELGQVISFSSGTAFTPRAKQLGLDVVAPATVPAEIAARNAMLASYQNQASGVDLIAARNAMLASYQQAASVEFIAARNAMLGSYQQGGNDEIVVNGEVCQICWKYR